MRAPLTRWYYEYPIIKNKEKKIKKEDRKPEEVFKSVRFRTSY